MNNALLKLYITLRNLATQEDGQDLVEYALIIALIAIGAVTALGTLDNKIINTFNSIGNSL